MVSMQGEFCRRAWVVTAGKSSGWLGSRLAGLLLVLALHAGVFYGLWRARLLPAPTDETALFVNFIAPPEEKKTPEPQRPPEPQPKPKPRPIEPPPARQLVAETPVTAPADFVAPAPPPKAEPIQPPVAAAPAPTAAPAPVATTPLPTGPVALSSELSVVCPHHPDQRYPVMSKRLEEAGRVLVQVELSETGQITSAQVQSSSGFVRLDNAALAAVRTWRCTPAIRNGQPVRASALQSFKFELQGN
ncbi:MAG: periplasmic protein TonB [Comamonadaceae bacterium]|nr:MAG: periplasmic protein TonB [Comamonadaceae bacterium]